MSQKDIVIACNLYLAHLSITLSTSSRYQHGWILLLQRREKLRFSSQRAENQTNFIFSHGVKYLMSSLNSLLSSGAVISHIAILLFKCQWYWMTGIGYDCDQPKCMWIAQIMNHLKASLVVLSYLRQICLIMWQNDWILSACVDLLPTCYAKLPWS